MSDSARVIMTYKCNRKCPGCANTYSSVMSKAQLLTKVSQLKDYTNLVISGGEPMLFPDRIINLAKILRKAAPQAKVYLYTAYNKNNKDIERVLPYIDGINYTVHETPSEQDIQGFQGFQDIAAQNKDKGFRLYVDKETAQKLQIHPEVWERIKMTPWMSEDEMVKAGGCPEDLFVLTKEPRPTKMGEGRIRLACLIRHIAQ